MIEQVAFAKAPMAASVSFADIGFSDHHTAMDIERDAYGVPVDPAERMQQVLLGLFDLMDEAGQADFPTELIVDLDALRRRFMDEFERRFPGYGKGRAVWR